MRDRGAMALRAAYLIAAFLPFLLLAPLLFLLSSLLLRWAGRRQSRLTLVTGAPALPPTAAGSGGLPAPVAAAATDVTAGATAAAAVAVVVAAPAKGGSGFSYLTDKRSSGYGNVNGAVDGVPGIAHATLNGLPTEPGPAAAVAEELSWSAGAALAVRTAAWQLLLSGVRAGGAAFIKWGQWSATREDMFPAVRPRELRNTCRASAWFPWSHKAVSMPLMATYWRPALFTRSEYTRRCVNLGSEPVSVLRSCAACSASCTTARRCMAGKRRARRSRRRSGGPWASCLMRSTTRRSPPAALRRCAACVRHAGGVPYFPFTITITRGLAACRV